MKMYMKGNKRSKESANPLPNTIAYAAIKNFWCQKNLKKLEMSTVLPNLTKTS